MKILLFFSGHDSLSYSFMEGFTALHHEVKVVNYLSFVPKRFVNLYLRSYLLPSAIRNLIEKKYFETIQNGYKNVLETESPDLVLVYNDQMLLAETVIRFRKKTTFAVYLADSPLFLQRRGHIIELLQSVNHVFAPDSAWLQQINLLGVRNTTFLIAGYNSRFNFSYTPEKRDQEKYANDIFYLGSPYKDTWGYRRALFLNSFARLNAKFYGPESWKPWFGKFPELERKFVLSNTRISDQQANTIMNCCKIYPIDANPGIINGIHVRVLDCIGSGILPLVEYRSDIDMVFPGLEIPVIKDYSKAEDIAMTYIENDALRKKILINLRTFLIEHFTSQKIALKTLNSIN